MIPVDNFSWTSDNSREWSAWEQREQDVPRRRIICQTCHVVERRGYSGNRCFGILSRFVTRDIRRENRLAQRIAGCQITGSISSVNTSEAAEASHKRKKKERSRGGPLAHFTRSHLLSSRLRGGRVTNWWRPSTRTPNVWGKNTYSAPMPCKEQILWLTMSGGFIQTNYTISSYEVMLSICDKVKWNKSIAKKGGPHTIRSLASVEPEIVE